MRRLSVKVRSGKFGLEKQCVGQCGQWLLVDVCFHRCPRGAFGRQNICKACITERRREQDNQRTGLTYEQRLAIQREKALANLRLGPIKNRERAMARREVSAA